MSTEREEELLLEIEELKQTIIEKDSIIDTLTTKIEDTLNRLIQ